MRVAVSKLLLTTTMLETVTLNGSTIRIEVGFVKLVPAILTLMELPCVPFRGSMEYSAGGPNGLLMLKVSALLVPPLVETVTTCGPAGALSGMLKVTVI